MTVEQIVALGVRLFSVWLAVYLIGQSSSVIAYYVRDGFGALVAISTFIFTLLIGIAIALWRFPLAVADKLLPKATLAQSTSLQAEQIQSAGFCLMGLWLLMQAIPGLFYVVVLIYWATRPNGMMVIQPQNYAAIVQIAVELVLGSWLLFGARGLLGLVRWARSTGTTA